jgi:hypothetical protein
MVTRREGVEEGRKRDEIFSKRVWIVWKLEKGENLSRVMKVRNE